MNKLDDDASVPASAPVAARPDNTKAHARVTAQRERILAAAQKCFIDHGFHAASMANIAQTAEMSPGLMYRYFPSKNAIVLAIIERQLQQTRLKIAELHASTDIAANVRRSFKQWQAADSREMNVALFLAMSADGSRDPQVAPALRASDQRTRADLEAWLRRSDAEGGRGLDKDVARSRALLMQCLIEGLAIRALREPDLDIDSLGPALNQLFDQMLAP